VLCQKQQETFEHLFLQCAAVIPIWTYISDIIKRITGAQLKPTSELCIQFNFPQQVAQHTDLLVLLYTMTRHTIWKARNAVRFDGHTLNPGGIRKMLNKALKYRIANEKRKNTSPYQETLNKLSDTMD